MYHIMSLEKVLTEDRFFLPNFFWFSVKKVMKSGRFFELFLKV